MIVADEIPGVSVLVKNDDGRIGLTYQAFARCLEPLNSTDAILDLTPDGRDERNPPWSMAWLPCHDQYGANG